eukprot:m.80297 g.80297  ORF g.80297 m.80297 type:complete len:442 (-) comp8035_c0_seq2:29-1354(-)
MVHLVIIGANSNARDGLAGGALGARVVLRRSADQSTVGGLRRASSLEDALGGGSGASGQVRGAGLGGAAIGRAEVAGDANDLLNVQLVRQAAIGLRVAVVGGVGLNGSGGRGVRGHHVDTADARGTLVLGHEDVTLQTPGGAPGVLDDPVVLAGGGAVADSEDTMVQLGAASRLEDTGLVELEGGLVSLDGDGDGLLGDGSNELSLLVLGDIGVGGDLADDLGSLGGLALVGASGSVGVVGLAGDATVLLDVLEGVVHQTTVAALVALGGGAIHEVLLGEGDEVLGGLEVGTLERASGGERPARAALALVLDGGDGTLGAPVDITGVDLREGDLVADARGVEGAEVGGLELSQGEISELVHANGEGVLASLGLSVVLVDVVDVVLEDLEAQSLLSSRVGLAEGGLELGELGLHGGGGRREGDGSKCQDGDNGLHSGSRAGK